jgi:hypothetical protein
MRDYRRTFRYFEEDSFAAPVCNVIEPGALVRSASRQGSRLAVLAGAPERKACSQRDERAAGEKA